jgi:5-methylcytosine-specific restriction endonuclease McrA
MSAPAAAETSTPAVAKDRPIVQPTAPQRYRLQFTVGQETHDVLRRLQTLLRREIPDGDPGAIFDRAAKLLLERVEKEKLGGATKPRRPAIRSGTDSRKGVPRPPSRHIPDPVKRAVWRRDGGQCAFVSGTGRRRSETAFLELHHRRPYAMKGPATVDNIALRCRHQNVYEAELVFGPYHGPWEPATATITAARTPACGGP